MAIRIFFAMFPAMLLFGSAACNGGGGGGNGDGNTTSEAGEHSIARVWDEAILDAIRIDTPRPPVHARNLWHLSAAMYDAWAVYDPVASGYLLREKISAEDIQSARREAISYAAYALLKNRYALSVNAPVTLGALDELMADLGFDIANTSITGDAPAAIGNRAAAAVIALGDSDGSNQGNNYADPSYAAANEPLAVDFPGNTMNDPNRWQPLALVVAFTQNGLPLPSGVQPFIGARWNSVLPFALERSDPSRPYVEVGAPPLLGTASEDEYKAQFLEVIEKTAALSPDLPALVDISPGAYGNNPLGTNAGTGHPLNPATGAPYPSQVVKLGDFARVLAEFWADGPNSETPPGHWNTIANNASDHVLSTHQFEGMGEPLARLEWDVKLYFALNGALHDAAVNCWGVKRIYDFVRPISAIRFMGTKGQSSDPSLPSYDPLGLPLVPGLVELVTGDTWPVGRHEGLRCCVSLSGLPAPCVDSAGVPGREVSCVGEIALLSWPGEPEDKESSYSGVRFIRAKEWIPYQLDTFVTPAFPGYNSGHSTFSRSAAEVLAAFTGTAFFPGGLGESVAEKDSALTFELGPSTDIRLQWGTYFDAADQAGQSRLFGGIHVRADDFTGRVSGSVIGQRAFIKAKSYFAGTAQ